MLRDEYGKTQLPQEIVFGYADDETSTAAAALVKTMPDNSKAIILAIYLKAKVSNIPGITFAENVILSGKKALGIKFREDIDCFLRQYSQDSSDVLPMIEEIESIDFSRFRAIAILGHNTMQIIVYSLEQIEQQLKALGWK
jgi:hypothetical protein